MLKSTCQIYSNNNSSLKNSKSGETEEGETSNEIWKLLIFLIHFIYLHFFVFMFNLRIVRNIYEIYI